ncbi:hypothetical protein GS429_14365 [Natronorubrum sp. JWXQ-INN-674]|uniref:Halobacterial output domain-containing protein n=1 Tax=Natronorubrum halalkaliphilum TaxID=2691917 RepID=A0A6B0VRU9_9EURY|nr:HalOD1 output domain-containing protein [Natronorubrum halalkaliphilum]MXV63229.1 hypothetical protein [Natronorubrum halalkaliphilum]
MREDSHSFTEPTVRAEVQEHEEPSIAVVRVLEALEDDGVSAHGPLYEYVDPESVDALFDDTTTGTRNGSVMFSIEDVDVCVIDGEYVELRT